MSGREGFTGRTLKGRKEQLSSVCQARTRACCTKKVAFSAWASFLSFAGLLHHIRHVHPRPGVEPCDSRSHSSCCSALGFSITFPAVTALLLPFPLPHRFLFFSLKEKSVNLNFLLDRPHWGTDTGLIRWYLFIFSATSLHKSRFLPSPFPAHPPPSFQYCPVLIVSPGMFALGRWRGDRQLIRRCR